MGIFKSTWQYFIKGMHRFSHRTIEDIIKELDWHESPLLGRYVRTKENNWWADAQILDLPYHLRLSASGPEPTSEQIESFEAVVKRMPSIIEESDLELPPEDDGWGSSPPPFDPVTAPISSIRKLANGNYFIIIEIDPEQNYLLAPVFELSPDLSLRSAEWAI